MQVVEMQLSLPGFGVNTSPMAVVSLRGQISPVRRRLSFSSDSEGETTPTVDNRVALKRQLLKIQEEQSLKWNFDFVDEQPMSGGRYIWEPTLPDRPSHPLPPPAGIKRSIDNQQQDSTPLCKQLKSDNNLNNTMNNNHRAVVQAKITDFMKNQKISEPMAKRRDNGSLASSAAGLNGH